MPQMLFSVYLCMQMFYLRVEEVGKHHFTHFHTGVATGILISRPMVYTKDDFHQWTELCEFTIKAPHIGHWQGHLEA